jgi:arylsulfatase A-like enzyme
MIRFFLLPAFLICAQIFGGQPNVIIILTDDQGWGDVGYNNQKVYTPNIDKLANSGALFTNHYVMAQCTPTRVALLTGRYPSRFGRHATAASTKPAFPKGTPTISSMLQSKGYDTCLSGKWHLGSSPDHGPNHFGFDQSYGCLSGAVGNYNHGYRKGPLFHTWHRNHKLIEGGENSIHTTELITDDAIRFIREKRNNPFFLYLPYTAVHTPLDERGKYINQPTQLDRRNPNRWKNESAIPWFNDPLGKIQQEHDPEKRLFLAALHHLDHAIGRVIDTLKDQNLYDNTLLLFSSDNGPQVNWPGNAYPDDLKLTDFNQPIPMRGRKIDVYEGGIKVPGFAVWPEKIKAQKINSPMHIVDWFPTIAQVIAYQTPSNIGWDGVDQSKTILMGTNSPERDFYWVQSNHRRAVRHDDWKVVCYSRKIPQNPSDWALYNLNEDPLEENDLSSKHPKVLVNLHNRFLKHQALDKIN